MTKKTLTIIANGKGWASIKGLKPRLEKTAAVALTHLPAKLRFPITANLLLTTDAAIRRLNRDFRGMDKATNVLSFPQFEPAELGKFRGQKDPVEMGDIVIAYQYMVAEAKKDHKILINHITHLFLHGLLHLFGYDHGDDREAGQMEGLETKIMQALKLPDPYSPTEIMEPKRKPTAAKKKR